MTTPQFKQLRRSYGFDEVAIVPGEITINPDQTDIDLRIGNFTFSVPISYTFHRSSVLISTWIFSSLTCKFQELEVDSPEPDLIQVLAGFLRSCGHLSSFPFFSVTFTLSPSFRVLRIL